MYRVHLHCAKNFKVAEIFETVLKVHKRENFLTPILNFVLFIVSEG
jgi:hypothetical protein